MHYYTIVGVKQILIWVVVLVLWIIVVHYYTYFSDLLNLNVAAMPR